MLLQPTIQTLKSLKLFGMAEAFQSMLEMPDSESLSFMEKMGLIVDREVSLRDNRRQSRLQKEARFRIAQACAEDIDYQSKRGLEKNKILGLVMGDWIKRHQNLIIVGPTGVGKTYLACALGNKACRLGLSVRFVRLPRLFEKLRMAQADGKYSTIMNQLSKTDLLILDDWGLGNLSKNERQDLLEILEDRHELKSTAITTQLPVELWHEYIGDATLADAILDRLLSNAHKVVLDGPSLRPKEPELDSKRSPDIK